jgi:hypothetical protein
VLKAQPASTASTDLHPPGIQDPLRLPRR